MTNEAGAESCSLELCPARRNCNAIEKQKESRSPPFAVWMHLSMPDGIRIVPQGEYVANSLVDYLHRHPEMDSRCSRGATMRYYTTESPERFKECARIFLHEDITVEHIDL